MSESILSCVLVIGGVFNEQLHSYAKVRFLSQLLPE